MDFLASLWRFFQSCFETISNIWTNLQRFYSFYLDRDHYRHVFSEQFGLDKNTSEFYSALFVSVNWAVAFAFFGFCVCLSKGMLSAKQAAIGLLAFVGFCAIPPFTQMVYGTLPKSACFSQTNGKPIKWFAVRSSNYVLYDEEGFDTHDGTARRPVTADVCRAYEQQRAGIVAQPLSIAEALDSLASGLWYYRRGNSLYIYSVQVPIPGTKELTKPVTPEIIAEIRARDADEKRRIAEAEAKQLADQRAQAEQQKRNLLLPLQNALGTVPSRYKCVLKDDGLILDTDLKDPVAFEHLSVSVDDFELEGDAGGQKLGVRGVQVLGPEYPSNKKQFCLALAISSFDPSDSVGVARLEAVLDTFRAFNSSVSYRREIVPADPTPPMSYTSPNDMVSNAGTVELFGGLVRMNRPVMNHRSWPSYTGRSSVPTSAGSGHAAAGGRR